MYLSFDSSSLLVSVLFQCITEHLDSQTHLLNELNTVQWKNTTGRFFFSRDKHGCWSLLVFVRQTALGPDESLSPYFTFSKGTFVFCEFLFSLNINDEYLWCISVKVEEKRELTGEVKSAGGCSLSLGLFHPKLEWSQNDLMISLHVVVFVTLLWG